MLSLGALAAGEKPRHGVPVAPQFYAPSHQHLFNVQLDFDLDGVENTVQQIDVTADPLDERNPFENAFKRALRPLSRKIAPCIVLSDATTIGV